MKKFHALLDNVSAFNPSGRNLQLCKITAGLLNPQGFFKIDFFHTSSNELCGYQNWNFIEHDLFFVAGWLLEHRKTKTCTSPGWALRDLALSTDVKPMHHSTVNKYPLTHRVRQHIFGGMHLMCVCVLVKEDEIIVGFWARTFPRKGCRRNFQPAHMMVIYCLELRVNFSKRAFMSQDWPQLFLRYTTCNYVLKG